jgi:hypothetical protein
MSGKKSLINQICGGALREKYARKFLKTFSSVMVRSIVHARRKLKYTERPGVSKVTNSKLHTRQRISFETNFSVKDCDGDNGSVI